MDHTGDTSVVELKSWKNLNIAQASLEGSNALVALGNILSFYQDTSFTLTHILGVLLCLAVDGGDKAIGHGLGSLVDVILLKEDVFGSFSG